MVLFVAYAFYYRNVFSPTIYHHMPRERRCLRHSGAQQSHLPAEFLSNRRHRHRGMAASSPLHRDASASRQPSSHRLHGITASNAALPSRKVEGLVGLRCARARRDLQLCAFPPSVRVRYPSTDPCLSARPAAHPHSPTHPPTHPIPCHSASRWLDECVRAGTVCMRCLGSGGRQFDWIRGASFSFFFFNQV